MSADHHDPSEVDIARLLSSRTRDTSWIDDMPPLSLDAIKARAQRLTDEQCAAIEDEARRVEFGDSALELGRSYLDMGDLESAERFLHMASKDFDVPEAIGYLEELVEIRAELPKYQILADGTPDSNLYSTAFEWARNIIQDAKDEAARIAVDAVATMEQVANQAHQRATSHTASRRSLLICCDLRADGSADDQLKRLLKELLVQSLDRAGVAAGLDRSRWQRHPSGHGEFAVLPPVTPEPLVVDDFVRALAAELRSVNRYRLPETKVRLRLALHHGAIGFPGADPVLVSRLLDSRPARLALERSPNDDLVVVLSEHLYGTLVKTGHTSLRPDDFREVEIVVKGSTGHGWLWLPDGNVHALDLGEDAPAQTGTVNQHAVASGSSTIYQAGNDIRIPQAAQNADVIQNFQNNDMKGSHFDPSYPGLDGN